MTDCMNTYALVNALSNLNIPTFANEPTNIYTKDLSTWLIPD